MAEAKAAKDGAPVSFAGTGRVGYGVDVGNPVDDGHGLSVGNQVAVGCGVCARENGNGNNRSNAIRTHSIIRVDAMR